MENSQNFDLSNRIFYLVLILIAGILIFFVAQSVYSFRSLDTNRNNQVSVSGEGKAYVVPDIGLVTLGVQSDGQTTEAVIKDNTTKMNAIINAMKELKVEDKDIKTTNYSLSPKYNYTKDRGTYPDGYTLSQNVQIKIRDFSKIGDILNQATSKGANIVNNLQFTVDDPSKVKEEARAKAIEKAKESAESLARESGIKLGRLVNVYENYVPYYLDSSKAYGMGGAESSAVAPMVARIEPGQQEITVNINLVYEVR